MSLLTIRECLIGLRGFKLLTIIGMELECDSRGSMLNDKIVNSIVAVH